jgi:hypothetical protein
MHLRGVNLLNSAQLNGHNKTTLNVENASGAPVFVCSSRMFDSGCETDLARVVRLRSFDLGWLLLPARSFSDLANFCTQFRFFAAAPSRLKFMSLVLFLLSH